MATTMCNGLTAAGPSGRYVTRVTSSTTVPVEVARWVMPQKTVTRVTLRANAKTQGGEGYGFMTQSASLIRETGDARVVADSSPLGLGVSFTFAQAGDDVTACVLAVDVTADAMAVDVEIKTLSVNAAV